MCLLRSSYPLAPPQRSRDDDTSDWADSLELVKFLHELVRQELLLPLHLHRHSLLVRSHLRDSVGVTVRVSHERGRELTGHTDGGTTTSSKRRRSPPRPGVALPQPPDFHLTNRRGARDTFDNHNHACMLRSHTPNKNSVTTPTKEPPLP